MSAHEDLVTRINNQYPHMSKGQKRIAEYILHDYDKAAFMTALKLAEKAGVSESTVVRFAMAIDFDGYPALQRALQEMVRNRLTTLQRMELSSDMSHSMVLRSVLKADMNNLRMTIEEINAEVFDDIVESVYSARKLYIMGLRSSAPLAQFLGYYLSFFLDNVQVVTSGVNDVLEQLFHIGPEDVLIGISLPRYSRRTMEGMRYAQGRGAQLVAITDSLVSPLASLAGRTLVARSDIASFVDSLVAPLSVVNALIVAIGMREKEEVSSSFMGLEHIWEQYHVYADRERDEEA